jgi:O-antigen ligase
LAPHLQWIKTRPARIHALVLAILVLGGLAMLFGGEGVAIHALGRQTNLTGRTEIWRAIIPACPNPVLGAGFESFWIGPDVRKVWYQLSNWWGGGHINEAHNGYIEVYLNLGFVGLGLIAWILISGYKRIDAALRCKSESAGLMLALVGTAAIYSVTEAGFRMLNPMWFFLLLAVFGARGTTRVPSVSSAAGRRNLAARAREELALGRPPLTSAYSRSSMEG